MKENKIRHVIRRLLFEDHWVANATDDKSAGKFVVDSDVKSELPLNPSPQIPGQVSVDAPPIDDDNYIPSSSVDLAKALYHLFKDCPQDQLEFVYRNAHKIRSSAETKAEKFEVHGPDIDDSVDLETPVRKSTKNKNNPRKN